MQKKDPVPERAGITTLHKDIASEARFFLAEASKAESELPTDVDWSPGPASESFLQLVQVTQKVQMYSRAAQLSSLLAIEAFLNEYGYIRLGEVPFEQKFEWLGPSKKLAQLLTEAIGYHVKADSEIARLVRSLSHRRNALVHPRPELRVWSDDGTVIETRRKLGATSRAAAEDAVSEMDRFFALFNAIDPEAAQILLGHLK